MITLFLIDNEVIIEERKDLKATQIEAMKVIIAKECSCNCEDIEVQFVESELSEIDVTNEGMFDWTDVEAKILTGVKLNLIEGSDEHLDAINNGSVENYLIFN